MDYDAIRKHVEAALYDIVTRKQVKVAKQDIMTRLAPKDKVTEKLGDCGSKSQHMYYCSEDYGGDRLYVNNGMCPDVNCQECIQAVAYYSYLDKRNSQSGENDASGEYEPTAEEKFSMVGE